MSAHVTHPETWALVGSFALIVAISIGLSFFVSWVAVLLIAVGLGAIALVWRAPEWGIYALAFAAPMSGLVIDFSREPSLARLPYIGGINAPLVDFLALLVLVVGGLLFLFAPQRLRLASLKIHAGFFLAWLAAAALAVWFGDHAYLGIAVKAWVRPYAFTYIAFVIPILLFTKSRRQEVRALQAYELAAVVGALMGLISIFILPIVGFVRAQPFSFLGWSPFGTNHNVLAESLTAIIPFAWWYFWRQENHDKKIWWGSAAILITTVSLLTFSRAAWIVVVAQLILIMAWQQRSFFERFRRSVGVAVVPTAEDLVKKIIAVAIIVFIIFFATINSTQIAESSNATRTDLNGIALMYFLRAPLFGIGPGTFVSLVSETTTFQMDYGDPLDAHGVVQKLATETGLLGLITFVLLVGALLYKIWHRRTDSYYWMLGVTIVSVWLYQLFNTGYFAGKVWVLMGLALVALFNHKEYESKN